MDTLGIPWPIPSGFVTIAFASTLLVLVAFVATRLADQSEKSMGPPSADARWTLLQILGLLGRICRTIAANALNTLVYAVTLGRHTRHQGRLWRWWGKWEWTNWNRSLSGETKEVFRPESEQALCQELQQELQRKPSLKVRVAGSGHSFNLSPLSPELMVSLEDYRLAPPSPKPNRFDAGERVEWLDEVVVMENGEEKKEIRVRVAAGMRLRDLTRTLWSKGVALPVTGSTDAQSLAGLLATDVHGTGQRNGFISEQVRSVRIVDSTGRAKTLTPDSSAFRAAIGGLGTCGIITEVELACEPAFTLEKSSLLVRRSLVDENIAQLVQQYDHVSFYELGGVNSDHIRMNVWQRSIRAPSALLNLRRVFSELVDMGVSGFVFEGAILLRLWKKARFKMEAGRLADFILFLFKLTMDGKHSVHPVSTGFTRTLFFRHEELEFCLPIDKYRVCMEELRQLLADREFLTVIETRFAPANRTPSLLGPGAVSVGTEPRMVCFIDLNPSVSYGEEIGGLFKDAAKILQKHGGLPHLGKQVPDLRAPQTIGGPTPPVPTPYGERLAEFQKARDELDPEKGHFMADGGTSLKYRMFANEFTDRVIGR